MEEERNAPEQAEEQTVYQPRPAWQVWAARIGLIVFLAFVLMYYVNVARGGV